MKVVESISLFTRATARRRCGELRRYIGKVCCLLLMLAENIGPRPRARPRGHGESLKLSCCDLPVAALSKSLAGWRMAGHEYALVAARARRRRTAVAGCCSAADAVNREHHSSESAGGSLGFTPSPALRVRL